jgi:MFS transporter, DHA2 family, multidrug resistance protein
MYTLAPTMRGLILTWRSWQMVFAVGAPIALLSIAIGLRSLPRTPMISAPHDGIGAALCATSTGLAVSGLESIVHANAWELSAALLVPGVVLLIAFVRRELTSTLPILPLDLVRRPLLALSSACSFIAFIDSMSFLVSLPFRLQHSYGFVPVEVVTMMAAWPLVMIFVAPAAGLLSGQEPAGILGGIGMAVAATALALIAFLPAAPTHADVMWRMALGGVGFGLFLTPNARLIVGSVPISRAATVGGFVSMTRLTGQTLGATLTATLLGLHLGGGPVPALISCGLVVVAGVLSVARLTSAGSRAAE